MENYKFLEQIFNTTKPKIVVNLAAQAGVRFSLENPFSYVQSNLVGFTNILEICRKFSIANLIYASSSSVYGGNISLPYSESQNVDHLLALCCNKRANELMAHSYVISTKYLLRTSIFYSLWSLGKTRYGTNDIC